MSNRYEEEILRFFLYNPMKSYGVRELGRVTRRNTKTVMKYLKSLKIKGIVKKTKLPNTYPYYEPNRLAKSYKIVKANYIINKIAESGLVDYLDSKLHPKSIILFGSVQKGTYTKESDVDLFVQSKNVKLSLDNFSKKIGHEIQIYFEEDINKLSKNFKNNIINGFPLSGGIEI